MQTPIRTLSNTQFAIKHYLMFAESTRYATILMEVTSLVCFVTILAYEGEPLSNNKVIMLFMSSNRNI